MNDYALINSLLKDGSEQSLLKLKMIVDFEDTDHNFIYKKYYYNFIMLFEDFFKNEFRYFPEMASHVSNNKFNKVLRTFKESFEFGFSIHPHFIAYFNIKQKIKILKMFNGLFKEKISEELLEEDEGWINFLTENEKEIFSKILETKI